MHSHAIPSPLRRQKIVKRSGKIVLTQNFLNQLPMLVALAFSFPAAIWLSIAYPWSVEHLEIPLFNFAFPLPLFAIIPLLLLGALFHALYNVRLILCPEYLIYVEGALNWKEKSIRVEYEHIREIEIDQTIYQRIVNVGDILVTVVATSIESSLIVPGVHDPRAVKDLIREFVAKAEKSNASMGIHG